MDTIIPYGVLSAVGAWCLASYVIKALLAFYKMFLRPAKKMTQLGEWVVVTGATDGIGKAYALAMAKQGMKVVLISRTESKLQEVQKQVQALGQECTYVVCDYSNFNDKARKTISTALTGLDIGVLINNVGVSYRYPRFYHELSDDEVSQLVEMNVLSTTWMTRIVLPGMLQRKRGSIVNISSGSAMYSLALLAGYSAAKSYIEKFSRALHAEYSTTKGITCQCQIPFYVATKLAKMRKSLMVPTPEEYVALAMKWIGHSDAVVVSPFVLHALQGWLLDQLPNFMVTKIIMDMHLAIRKRGMKKDAASAARGEKKKE